MTFDHSRKVIRKQAAQWVDRLRDRDLPDAEREEFRRWLLTSAVHEEEFRGCLLASNLSGDLPEATRTELLMMAMEDIERERTRTKAWLPALAASVAICAVGIAGWFGYRYATASTDYVTTAGATRDVTLPDGSVAHLNSRTDLRWVGRSGERRVVLLEGEAFFEVTHDPSRPFSVILDHSQIRVVGTRFNVRRRENQEVVVTVLEGTVQVLPESVSGSAQPVWMRTLHANEQLVYNNTGLIRDVYSADRANAAKWRQGILEFEDEPLSNIVEDLGRYTDRHIVVRDPRLAQLHLGGQLNVHNDVKASLGLLGKLAPLEVHESGNTFVLNYRQEPTKERP